MDRVNGESKRERAWQGDEPDLDPDPEEPEGPDEEDAFEEALCARCGEALPHHPGCGRRFTYCSSCAVERHRERERARNARRRRDARPLGPREAWIGRGFVPGAGAPAPSAAAGGAKPLPKAKTARPSARAASLPIGRLAPFEGLRLASGLCPDCGARALRRGPREDGAWSVKCRCGAGFRLMGDSLGLGAIRLAGSSSAKAPEGNPS